MSLNNAHEGYDYQDLLTSYFILKEILGGNKNSLFLIDKKHTSNDRFDDLVIKNGSKMPFFHLLDQKYPSIHLFGSKMPLELNLSLKLPSL